MWERRAQVAGFNPGAGGQQAVPGLRQAGTESWSHFGATQTIWVFSQDRAGSACRFVERLCSVKKQ